MINIPDLQWDNYLLSISFVNIVTPLAYESHALTLPTYLKGTWEFREDMFSFTVFSYLSIFFTKMQKMS